MDRKRDGNMRCQWLLRVCLYSVSVVLGYLFLWPVPIEPVSWQAPVNNGFTGAFKQNRKLANIDIITLSDTHGPEAIAIKDNRLYASTREGWIIRLNESTGQVSQWVNTQGSPLGIAFDSGGNLIVADAYRGLLSISEAGQIRPLSQRVNGQKIGYADDLDIASDGKIYFSDASSKFSAQQFGGIYPASRLDILEHGGHGRLLVYDPANGSTEVVMRGLNFANGVAIDEQSRFVLVCETGSYRIHKYWLAGDKAGTSEVLIDNLPGFPDNVVRGREGRFWIGLVSPRNDLLDRISSLPLVRKVVQRLPDFLQPQAQHYSHVFAINGDGKVLTSLQDPEGHYHTNTGALESEQWLYISSLHAADLARISKQSVGL
jgi:sugar lactone lactonase YvrE